MKKIANSKQLASGALAMNLSTSASHRLRGRTTPVINLCKALFISLAVLTLLNACSEGNDNVTPGSIRGITGGLGDPTVTQGVPEVDRFVATVYNGKDAEGRSSGVLFPRCGNCHNSAGSKQKPYFADTAAATAYLVATTTSSLGNPLFDLSLSNAKNSAVVLKVKSGHNCWSGSSAALCQKDADELTDRITDWINLIDGTGTGTGGGGPSTVERSLADTLQVQVTSEVDPSPSKTFPDTAGGDFTSLHNLLTANCQGCHVSTAATPQAPYFADSDPAVSYAALKDNQKIDINNFSPPELPNKSRLYLRLLNDAHNCWTTCVDNAATILAAIKVFSDPIQTPTALPAGWVTSKALKLDEGQVVSGGVRYEPNVIAKYEFKEGTGTVAKDTSGFVPAIDLNLTGNVNWVSGWGVQFLPASSGQATSRLMSGSVAASRKLRDLIIPNGEYSIEAWIIPGNVSQGADAPAVIMSYAGGANSRNLTLGQQLYNYTLATRIDTANADQDIASSGGANELLATPDADEVLQATLQHVVVTYRGTVDTNDANAVGRKVYINGELVFSDPAALGVLDDWDEGYLLALGADPDGSNPFLGRLRFLAIHNRAIPAAKALQNFEAGVGQKFNLLFKVGHLDDNATNRMHDQSYILMTIEEFDDFSYKIFDPRFVVLGADVAGPALAESTGQMTIRGMRIGINGKEPEVGQVFGKLDTTLTWTATAGVTDIPQVSNILSTNKYDFATGSTGNTGGDVPSRATGTIIPKASGADVDQFFLTFEDLGGTYARTDASTPQSFSNNTLIYNSGPDYNFALRNFDEVYATLTEITGVDPVTQNSTVTGLTISELFQTVVRAALPSVEDPISFVSAHQVAVTKMTFEFCNALVDDSQLRNAFFDVGGTFNFGGNVTNAFNPGVGWTGMNIIIDSLITKVVGSGIGNQPAIASIKDILTDDTANANNTVRGLYEGLAAECVPDAGNATSCTDSTRTPKIVKSMCMAVLGSAPMLVQ